MAAWDHNREDSAKKTFENQPNGPSNGDAFGSTVFACLCHPIHKPKK